MSTIPEGEFNTRFLLGRVFLLLPVFTALLARFWTISPGKFWVSLSLYSIVLAFSTWLAIRSAPRHLALSREMGSAMVQVGVPDDVRSHVIPLGAAAVVVGTIMGLIKWDLRWLLLASIFAGLLGVGLLFRWMVYERWLLGLARRYQT